MSRTGENKKNDYRPDAKRKCYEPKTPILRKPNTPKHTQHIIWQGEDKLAVTKIFRFNDEPSARGLTKEEADKYSSTSQQGCMFEQSRLKEIEMEKLSIRKVKEKESEFRKRLQEMKEDLLEYLPPLECSSLQVCNGEKSEEKLKQRKRESTIFAMQYIKESQIPPHPKELEEKYFNESSDDILVIKLQAPHIKKRDDGKPTSANLTSLVMDDKPKPTFENKFSSQLAQALAQTLINTISLIPRLPQSAPAMQKASMKQKYSSVEDMPKPPNYKTVPCRLFHSTVGCSRGEYCHFIHDEKYAGREIPQYELQKRKHVNMMQPMMQPMMPRPMMPFQMPPDVAYQASYYPHMKPQFMPPQYFPGMMPPQ